MVCDTEISHYKKIAPEIFELVDISNPSFDAAHFGLTSEAVQRHMHLQTPEGKILIGVDAFAYLWSRLPQYRWASKIIKWPVIYQMACLGYEVFARHRHLLPQRRNR